MKSIPKSHFIIIAVCILMVIIAAVAAVFVVSYFTNDTSHHDVDFGHPESMVLHNGESFAAFSEYDSDYKPVRRLIAECANSVSDFKQLDNIDVSQSDAVWVEYKYPENITFYLTVDGKEIKLKTNYISFILSGEYAGYISVGADDTRTFGMMSVNDELVNAVKDAFGRHFH